MIPQEHIWTGELNRQALGGDGAEKLSPFPDGVVQCAI